MPFEIIINAESVQATAGIVRFFFCFETIIAAGSRSCEIS